MDVEELDPEQLREACRTFPVVKQLMEQNLHLSVSALAGEMRAKLQTFDGNHTRAQARLVERIEALEIRTKDAVAGLHKRIKELESQNADRTLAQGRIMETLGQQRDRIEELEPKQPTETVK